MVVLLVFLTFAVFLAVDVIRNREKYRIPEAQKEEATPLAIEPMRTPAPVVAGIPLPESRYYHPAHTWAMDLGNGRIRVGIDEFAASLLGDIRSIEVRERGRWLRQGDRGWTVETSHGPATMLAPAEGEIVSINDMAIANPEMVEDDPYEAGWLLELRTPDSEISFRNLLSGALARKWMEETIDALRQHFSSPQMATALDGGHFVRKIGKELPQKTWNALTHEFFRS